VIPPDWSPATAGRPGDRFSKTVERKDTEYAHDPQAYLHAPDVWTDFAVLLKHRPDLEVTVIRLFWPTDKDHKLEAHERLLWRFAYRLGVWDHREASMFVSDSGGDWEFPEHRTATDPNDLAEAFQCLFEVRQA